MGEYLPYAGTNAIQEATIAVHFRGDFVASAVERARANAIEDLKDAFPRSNDIRMAEIKIDNETQNIVAQGGNTPSGLVGFELLKVKADGAPARVLRLVKDILAVNFLVYESWSTTLLHSLQYMRSVLSHMNLEENSITAFSLRYIDRFTFDGDPKDAHAGLLLRNGNAYMAAHCFESEAFWHCHSGWFESNSKYFRILNQLNIGSAMVDQAPTITIDHNGICQFSTPRQSIDSVFSPSTGKELGVEGVLNRLHGQNGTILGSLLLENMLTHIGMRS